VTKLIHTNAFVVQQREATLRLALDWLLAVHQELAEQLAEDFLGMRVRFPLRSVAGREEPRAPMPAGIVTHAQDENVATPPALNPYHTMRSVKHKVLFAALAEPLAKLERQEREKWQCAFHTSLNVHLFAPFFRDLHVLFSIRKETTEREMSAKLQMAEREYAAVLHKELHHVSLSLTEANKRTDAALMSAHNAERECRSARAERRVAEAQREEYAERVTTLESMLAALRAQHAALQDVHALTATEFSSLKETFHEERQKYLADVEALQSLRRAEMLKPTRTKADAESQALFDEAVADSEEEQAPQGSEPFCFAPAGLVQSTQKSFFSSYETPSRPLGRKHRSHTIGEMDSRAPASIGYSSLADSYKSQLVEVSVAERRLRFQLKEAIKRQRDMLRVLSQLLRSRKEMRRALGCIEKKMMTDCDGQCSPHFTRTRADARESNDNFMFSIVSVRLRRDAATSTDPDGAASESDSNVQEPTPVRAKNSRPLRWAAALTAGVVGVAVGCAQWYSGD
jgi:hypothetical protein